MHSKSSKRETGRKAVETSADAACIGKRESKDTAFRPIFAKTKKEKIVKIHKMAQETVTRAEMRELKIGQTRIFTLNNPKKIRSVEVNARSLGKEERMEFSIKSDYDNCSIAITRIA